MTMTKRIAPFLLLLLLALAACAPPTTEPPPPAPPTATAEAVSAAVEPTVAPDTPDIPDTPSALPSATPPPTAVPPTAEPTATATATNVPWPTVLPTAVPDGPTSTPGPESFINGIQRGWFVVMPDEAGLARLRDAVYTGLELGRDPTRFSKMGDSVTTSEHYFARFDNPDLYDLAPYEDLQPTIDFFSGSFAHNGPAQRIGLATGVVFDPTWADKELCEPNETMLDCEIRRHNPAVLVIKLGTNDLGTISFEENMREIIEYTLAQGIIPILSTKADRYEGGDWNNPITRRLAEEYGIPLWDFDFVANTLYERGMAEDGIHLSMSNANVYSDPIVMTRGYPISDLTGLMVLDAVRREVVEPALYELQSNE
jgi:hypothetical protein